MDGDRTFWRVAASLDGAPLRDHLMHGYEERSGFVAALRRILERWGGRLGERLDSRNGFLLLRFHDTPGGVPDEEWLPSYLLRQDDPPGDDSPDEAERELDAAFGFD